MVRAAWLNPSTAQSLHHTQPTTVSPTVKNVSSQNPNMVSTNIIFFPSHLCRKAEIARKPGARVPHAGEVETDRSCNIRQFPQYPLRSVESTHGILAHTLEILSKRSGVYSALAIPHVGFSRSACSRRKALSAP